VTYRTGSSPFRIRPATPADADALLELKLTLDQETRFMMLEPGERRETPDIVAAQLMAIDALPNAIVLVAEQAGALVGYVEAQGGTFRRNRHSASVVIGIRKAAAGRGIGTALLDALGEWAVRCGVHRLELTVMEHNERAIGLYRRWGFEIEGKRRHSVRVDGVWIDELAMAKLLLPSGA
jgi:RimJ/RimL family protein N-acetyltransferase